MAGMKWFSFVLLGFHAGLIATSSYAELNLRHRSEDTNDLEALVMRQNQVIDQLQARLASVETNFKNEIANLKARLAEQETKVAFSARLSNKTHFTETHILVCDVVDLNQGGGYDKVTGVFSAPVSGLYVFSLKITQTPPGNMHIAVVKNGAGVIAEAEAEGETLDRSSSTVAVQLAKGDRVWVRRSSDSTATELQDGWRTLFTGFLVRPDHP